MRTGKRLWAGLSLCAAAFWGVTGLVPGVASTASGAPVVRFDQTEYVLGTATDRFRVDVLIDGDGVRPGLQPVAEGLLSFGVRVLFDPTEARVLDVGTDIAIVPALDYAFDGLAPGIREVGLTSGSAKGFVPLTDPAYGASLLASFFVTSRVAGPYTLSLAVFSQGPNESVFVDGNGATLDATLAFGSARVSVIPEPGAAALLSAVAPMLVSRRRRDRTA